MTSRDEGRERGRPARTTLAQTHPSLRPGSTGNSPTIPLQPSPGRSCRQGGRAPHHGETERPPNAEDAGETPALPEGRLLPSFLLREEAQPLPMRQCRPAWCAFVVLRVSWWITPFFFCFRQAPPLPRRADHPRVKLPIVNKLAAMTSREEALRERGRPARTTLAQAYPSLPPGSTGNAPTIPLQPSPWGSRRQGDRAPHHGEAERPPNTENAGETPALPGGMPLPCVLVDHSSFRAVC